MVIHRWPFYFSFVAWFFFCCRYDGSWNCWHSAGYGPSQKQRSPFRIQSQVELWSIHFWCLLINLSPVTFHLLLINPSFQSIPPRNRLHRALPWKDSNRYLLLQFQLQVQGINFNFEFSIPFSVSLLKFQELKEIFLVLQRKRLLGRSSWSSRRRWFRYHHRKCFRYQFGLGSDCYRPWCSRCGNLIPKFIEHLLRFVPDFIFTPLKVGAEFNVAHCYWIWWKNSKFKFIEFCWVTYCSKLLIE